MFRVVTSNGAPAWPPATAVLSVLRKRGPSLLAKRLASEDMPPELIAVAAFHFTELIESIAATAWPGEPKNADPLSDGTIAPSIAPTIVGTDYAEITKRLQSKPNERRLELLMEVEQDIARADLWGE